MSRVSPRIVFSWNGLPQYAARSIRCAADRLGEDCVVIGTPPDVPIRGMEDVLERPPIWIDARAPVSWRDIGLTPPQIFVQSGWAYPAINSLGLETKARGGFVIGMSDNNWRGDFRQLVLGPAAFRLLHRRRFDAMIVPGRQGLRLMRWYGMRAERVRIGMMGADPLLFHGGAPLASRPRTFLFVGQLIARKNVLGLSRAFLRFCETRPGWRLQLCGSGELRGSIPQHPNIFVEDFIQPDRLVDFFREARFLVLPSSTEAWGEVVHEAACCGCALVLSDRIGAADDLATPINSIRHRAGDEDDLLRALHRAAELDEARLAAAEAESRRLATCFGPERFADAVVELVRTSGRAADVRATGRAEQSSDIVDETLA
jgi:glycosyltransferase involved in cell wall biosynthesis